MESPVVNGLKVHVVSIYDQLSILSQTSSPLRAECGKVEDFERSCFLLWFRRGLPLRVERSKAGPKL